jgi:peptidoglycan/LPS O-acetylase OafA/YrhL
VAGRDLPGYRTVLSEKLAPPVSPSRRASTTKSYLRSDIQALRAIAVLLVVTFHLWPIRLTGGYVGVDVFFVISGFLITSHILRDVDKGAFRVTRFWARRLRRLLPASMLVLAVTAAGVWLWVPQQSWQQWFREIGASALYVQNWILAADSVDYMAADNTASPVQHFWTLSTEEQFYAVWPLFVIVALGFARLAKVRPRVAIGATLGIVVAASFLASLILTSEDPSYAYFVTPTRAWEFGAGALLAFAPPLARARTFTAWLGVAFIVFSAWSLTGETPFPGYMAALPVIGTAMVIWSNTNHSLTKRLIELPPVQFIGNISYSIYLWHWPLSFLSPSFSGVTLLSQTKWVSSWSASCLHGPQHAWWSVPLLSGGPTLGQRSPTSAQLP